MFWNERLNYDELPDLGKSQYWSLNKLKKFQNERLKIIINYAYHNIKAYKEKFDFTSISPKDIKSTDDLHKIPITTREEMQNNQNFINNSLVTNTLYTGGSTGSSLTYYESQLGSQMRWNAHLRGWSWNGYNPEKKIAIIASLQGGLSENDKTLNLIGDLTEENLKHNTKKLIEFQPQHIRGYVSSIYIMSKYCLDHDIKILGIESIDPISENLYEFQREIIEKVFNCKVFEEYCCNDGGACAWECEEHSNGLHYFMERAIIEEIDGEMIVTDLWNLGMPFIRYRNGDLVEFIEKKCSCGRTLPLVKVKGRTNDLIISKSGPISPTFLMHHGIGIGSANFRSGIRTIQYIQKKNYLLELNIVKNDWCTNKEIEDLKNKILEITHGMEININFVKEIITTAKGKRRFIINEDEELLNQWGY